MTHRLQFNLRHRDPGPGGAGLVSRNGLKKLRIGVRILACCCVLLGIVLKTGADDDSPRKPPPAVILTTAGTVHVATIAAPADWSPARTNQTLAVGDRLRTGEESRAALRLSNLSVLRVNELTTLVIRPPTQTGRDSVLDLRTGAIYFFNRERPPTHFRTPTTSGAIRGTEFHLEVDEDGGTSLLLLDGEVDLSNEFGEITLVGGELGIVEPGQSPRKTAVIAAINIIQWTLYYPAVLDVDELELDAATAQALSASLEAYRAGDLLRALADYPAQREPASEVERVYQAALLLSVGSVAEAQQQLAELQPAEGRAVALADALREMIAAVKNQPWTRTAPRVLASEWMAGSYYEQSQWRLEEALLMARAAAEQSPQFGFAGARVAELEFSFGRAREALDALEQSLNPAPHNAQAVSLKGFLLSAQNRHDAALRQFEQAIALDGSLGNAWLGRGLMRIRQGRREAGRQDLQVAAALEPTRSLLRSYLGKAFGHETDPARAARELELARRLDPNDPTPWLYSALLNYQRHRVNEAVRDLEESQDLNDNRRVFRSRMLLDQDRAVRNANLAAIYRDAGMTEFSAREASRAVHHDYANHSAHLFLANSYDALRDPGQVHFRHEPPWLSHLLIANLLAPAGAGSLSRTVSQHEYSRLFEGDRLGVFSFTEYLSNGDWFQQGSQFGTIGHSSYALDAQYNSRNGWRVNHDFEKLFLSARFKQQLTPQDGVYLQANYQRHEGGDLLQYYDPAGANPDLRIKEIQEPDLFAGYHREWRPGSHTLFLAGWLNNRFELSDPNAFLFTVHRDPGGNVTSLPLRRFERELRRDFTAYSFEAKHIQQFEQWSDHTLLLGGRAQTGTVESRSRTARIPPRAFPPIYDNPASDQQVKAGLDRFTVYGYHLWQVLEPLHLTAGVSYDHIRHPLNTDLPPLMDAEHTKDKVSPKVGLIWTPVRGTTLRAAYTRSIGGLFYDASVRLEPAQVAGFTQAYRSMIPESVAGVIAGSEFTTYGAGLDQKFASNTYLVIEAELLESEAERMVGAFDFSGTLPAIPSGTPQRLEFREKSLTAALTQLLGDQWSAGTRYRISQAKLRDRFLRIPAGVSPFAGRELEAVLHRLNLFLLWQHPSGIFTEGEALWQAQSNHGFAPDLPGDDLWQFNAFGGYRFPRRHAEVRVGVLNIGNRDYRLNPLNLHAELPRQRTLLVSLRLNF